MQKKVIIMMTILILLGGILIFTKFYNNKIDQGTIEEILNVNFNDISYVKVSNKKYSTKDFINEYKKKKYKKYDTQKLGNTRRINFDCYDSKDKIIFTLVELGNNDLILLKKGNFEEIYQLYQN